MTLASSTGSSVASAVGAAVGKGSGGGLPAFNPSTYGALALDLNPAVGAFQDAGGSTPAVADNDPVRLIVDQAGNASRNGVATADGSRPLLKLDFLNGMPVLQFDGDDVLAGINLSSLIAGELFIVIRRANEIDNGGYFATSTIETQHYPYNDGVIYDGWGSTVRKTTGNPSQDLTQWHVYNVVSVANEWTSRINGTQHFTTATNSVAFSSSCALGAGFAPSTTFPMAGEIARVIVYSAKLADESREALTAALVSLYGILV